MKRFKLTATPREITGKQVKKLRREGIMPANVYGKDIKSQSLQLPQTEFDKVFEEAGETGVIDLNYGTETIPVLVHNIHTDYRNRVLHADFFKVNLKEKVKAMIPLEFTGESKAVADEIGLLMTITSEVEVEALPTELPENIEVNVERLANIDEQITVADLKAPEGVEILTDPNQVIVKVGELVSKEAQEQAAEEAAAAEAAAAESGEANEGAETEAGAEGEPKPEGEQSGTEEQKKEPQDQKSGEKPQE